MLKMFQEKPSFMMYYLLVLMHVTLDLTSQKSLMIQTNSTNYYQKDMGILIIQFIGSRHSSIFSGIAWDSAGLFSECSEAIPGRTGRTVAGASGGDVLVATKAVPAKQRMKLICFMAGAAPAAKGAVGFAGGAVHTAKGAVFIAEEAIHSSRRI
jgi:hypothetical protein